MDDLTNSFNSFVTSGDYCSHTNLASNIHPRLLDYKKLTTTSNQEARRRKILDDQKKYKYFLMKILNQNFNFFCLENAASWLNRKGI